MSGPVPGIITSWILGTCWPLAPCPKPAAQQPQYQQVQPVQQPSQQPQVQIYQTRDPNNPALLEQRYQQVQNIGLSCEQRDLTINYLEQMVGVQPVDPENLSAPQRRLNSAARTKIWQLRTYCR